MKPLNTSHSQCYIIQFSKFQSVLDSLVCSSSNSGGNISICVSCLHYIVISLYHWFLFLCMCACLSFPRFFYPFSCFSPFSVSLIVSPSTRTFTLILPSFLSVGVHGSERRSLWRLLSVCLWQMGPSPPCEGHRKLQQLVQWAHPFLAETAQRLEFRFNQNFISHY